MVRDREPGRFRSIIPGLLGQLRNIRHRRPVVGLIAGAWRHRRSLDAAEARIHQHRVVLDGGGHSINVTFSYGS